MDINRFTEKAQQALSAAQTRVARYSHQQVDVEHLLAALLEQERGLAVSIFNKAGEIVEIQPGRLRQRLEERYI
jgi:ATP-dependent Clp protease ATP-binding subunit ClpB